MKYICSYSGGKDSTASVILAHLKKEPLDTILFSEVMFDENTSGENPGHIEFITNRAKPLFESLGYEVKILRSEKTYLDLFHHVIKNPRKYESHRGRKYGFAVTGRCSVKRDLKLKPIDNYLRSLGKEPYTQYVGICKDEPERLRSMHRDKSKVSLLEKYGYTEEMARNLCLEYDLLSPVYELSRRGGCWFCPYAKLTEHEQIRDLYPEVWNTFVSLEAEEKLANNRWNIYAETLAERDEILKQRKRFHQLTIFDYM